MTRASEATRINKANRIGGRWNKQRSSDDGVRTQLAIQCCGRIMKGVLTVSNKADLDCLACQQKCEPGIES
jgi:hypothetical protein